MYKTVLFDLDGTLLDTIEDLADAGNRVCAAFGWPQHTVAAFKYFVGSGIPLLVERMSPPAARDAKTQAAALARFQAEYGAHMFDKTRPYPGMAALLAELKARGVRMAVYSNKDDRFAGEVVARYYDPALFAAVRGARPGVGKKPAPEGTLALMAEVGAQPETTLYVGDSDIDAATAQNAGLPCCGVLWGFRTAEELRGAGAAYLAADAAALRAVILEG